MSRKVLTLTLVVILMFLVFGCGTSSTNDVSENELPKLIIGIDDSYEPYTYIDENGEYVGLDIELAKEACQRMRIIKLFEGLPIFLRVRFEGLA
jgi:polar amino acid transport system substrate-binding protein